MDRELVARAQHGDQGAFATLAETNVDRLLRVAHGILGDAHLAEDATQQALLAIWRDLPRLRDPLNFEAWSYRLVVNACRSEQRRSHRWWSFLPLGSVPEPALPDTTRAIADRDELEVAFSRLSVEHRAVVILHHYAGHSVAATARALDIPEGTVRSRLHHAMRRLRASLRAPATTTPVRTPHQEARR
jgi:RNA polymerase sigma-70 factor (ECF subfamily)